MLLLESPYFVPVIELLGWDTFAPSVAMLPAPLVAPFFLIHCLLRIPILL